MLLLWYAGVTAQEFPAVGPFRLVQERREWADAEARCVSIGGHLASVHDAEDAKAVSELCLSHLGEEAAAGSDSATRATRAPSSGLTGRRSTLSTGTRVRVCGEGQGQGQG